MERHVHRGSSAAFRIVVALLLAGGIAVAIGHRAKLNAEEAKSAQPSKAARRVLVANAKPAGSAGGLSLPGTVRSSESTTLYARAQGFVREVKVNLGATVKKGDLLVVIDAPELKDQLAVAASKLAEAESNVGLYKSRHDRLLALADAGAGTIQDVEDAARQYNTALAAVASARADVQRLRNTISYLRVTAPFDGTITRRTVDPGAVVNTGTTALLDLATTEKLKVVIDVPQSLAALVTKDLTADVTTKSGEKVHVTLLRAADALDEITRTLRVELAVPDGAPLIAGGWVDVKLGLTAASKTLVIPATVLSVSAQGTRVVVVKDGKAVYRKVAIVRDLGRELEVTGDLTAADMLMTFPPVDLVEGEPVEIAPPAK